MAGFEEYVFHLYVFAVEDAEVHIFLVVCKDVALDIVRYFIDKIGFFAHKEIYREVGIAAERDPDAPTKQWAQSIRRNPREFFRATRDAGNIVAELVAEREAQRARDEARGDRETAQKVRAVIESTAPIPRGGTDHNLPDVDLNIIQENVMAVLDLICA